MASRIHLKYWKKYFDSATMSNFCEMTPPDGSMQKKNFKLLKYEHIIFRLEARDLEISNI